ncbi:AAA family ATPase [Burkholderia pseudomallei]|uniref:AAA family ATPase n=1 Tax=Burkholderia pseudomallei TaxID=28450 RepID=UPI0002DDF888
MAATAGDQQSKSSHYVSTTYSDLDRSRSALRSLDPGCSGDEWVRIGMAAKEAGLTEDEFIEWSRPAPNFKGEQDVRSRWRSFRNGRGIGAATLFHMARDAGWSAAPLHGAAQSSRSSGAMQKPKSTGKGAQGLAATFEGYPVATADHPYIAAKRGNADGLRVVPADDPLTILGKRVAGWLAVPVRSLDGTFQTIQYIPAPGAGKKLNAPGASFGSGLLVVGDVGSDGTVFVCEGIGQAWACARADYHAAAAVAFGSGRVRTVAKLLRERHPRARIVIVPDKGKESDAEAIAREVGGAWVELPADKPANYDVNDYERDHDGEALAGLLRATRMPTMRYRLQSADDLLNAPPLRWLVRGVLPATGFAAVYGPSGSGKSFLALDLCAAIAGGSEWFGRRVTAAPVVYVCLEGEAGLSKRAKAWSVRNKRGLPGRLRFITQPLDLRQSSDIDDLSTAVLAAGGRGGLLVVDTLNRAAPGADENASTDMGEIIEASKELQRRTGGVVLLVHHTGKDGTKGLRGHSSLYAALDAAIEVNRSDDRREWSIAKSKDDADGERTAFVLRVVELGEDEDGEPVTSCIVEADHGPAEVQRVKLPQGGNQRIALDALADPLRKSADFGKGAAPEGRPCIEIEAAVPIVAARLTTEPKRRTERARDAIKGLVTRGVYGAQDGWLWRN